MGLVRALVALAVALLTLPAGASSVVLERVEVSPGPTPAVSLTLSAAVVPRTLVIEASSVAPRRLAIDLPGATLGAVARQVPAGSGGPLLRVRTSQFDAKTVRVVLDLSGPAAFTLATAGPVITVSLGNVASASPSPPMRPPQVQRAAKTTTPAAPSARVAAKTWSRRTPPKLFLDYDGIMPLPEPGPSILVEPPTPHPTPLGP